MRGSVLGTLTGRLQYATARRDKLPELADAAVELRREQGRRFFRRTPQVAPEHGCIATLERRRTLRCGVGRAAWGVRPASLLAAFCPLLHRRGCCAVRRVCTARVRMRFAPAVWSSSSASHQISTQFSCPGAPVVAIASGLKPAAQV